MAFSLSGKMIIFTILGLALFIGAILVMGFISRRKNKNVKG